MPEPRRRGPDTTAPVDRPAEELATVPEDVPILTIEQLGWSLEDAAAIRASLSSFAADWDHPSMAIYDGVQAR